MNYRLVDGGKRETSGIYMPENVIITYNKKYINWSLIFMVQPCLIKVFVTMRVHIYFFLALSIFTKKITQAR